MMIEVRIKLEQLQEDMMLAINEVEEDLWTQRDERIEHNKRQQQA